MIQELIFLIIKQLLLETSQLYAITHAHTHNSSHENKEISIVFMIKKVRTRFINFFLKLKERLSDKDFQSWEEGTAQKGHTRMKKHKQTV